MSAWFTELENSESILDSEFDVDEVYEESVFSMADNIQAMRQAVAVESWQRCTELRQEMRKLQAEVHPHYDWGDFQRKPRLLNLRQAAKIPSLFALEDTADEPLAKTKIPPPFPVAGE